MKTFWICVGLTTLVVGAFVAGSSSQRRHSAESGPAGGRQILYYVDPMNPAHTSKEPGLAPCGMKMEPVFADSLPASAGSDSSALAPGTVRVALDKTQLIGVRVGAAEKKPLHHTLRLLGKVAADETRLYTINATVDGWITKTLPAATGDRVEQNQVLATFYSPEFLAAGNALLFALNSKDRLRAVEATTTNAAESSRAAQFNLNLQQYADALKNLGMGQPQIDEMIRTRHFRQSVDIIAPAGGFLTARAVSDGLRFEKGTELYRIADLHHVWILADLFEKDATFVKPGAQASVTLPLQNKKFQATLSAALPQFDPSTRTLKLRLEAENPEFELKPDMFVDVDFPVSLPECMVVPADAVLDTGIRKTVFVERGPGIFEPRIIETGWRVGDDVEVTRGLEAGERIAISGTFLLDSESRMKLAAAGVHGASASAGLGEANPPPEPTGATSAAEAQGVALDPVCGMKVTEAKARAAHRLAEFEGKTYFFCTDGCREEFLEKPKNFLKPNQP